MRCGQPRNGGKHESRWYPDSHCRALRGVAVLSEKDGSLNMARPLPVNLLFAGAGAVLVVSGVGGESIGGVLKGSFGNLKPTPGSQQALSEGQGVTQNVVNPETGAPEVAAPGSEIPHASAPGSSTFAASPDTFRKHVSKQQEARSIAGILISWGIRNPTHADIERARAFYHKK